MKKFQVLLTFEVELPDNECTDSDKIKAKVSNKIGTLLGESSWIPTVLEEHVLSVSLLSF